MSSSENHATFDEEPLYNIGVVTRVTDIPIATLRAWEQRYGFPQAGRTPGRHRLYSEKDIAQLRWIKRQIDAGMQTSQAIRALQRLEREGGFRGVSPEAVAVPPKEDAPALAAMQERLTAALTNHDLDQADQVMGELLAFYAPEDLLLEVIGPTLAAIGHAWSEGRITVATEHLASAYLRHRLLIWLVNSPPPRPARPVVLACAPDEWHEGSLLMLGVVLRRRRWPVAYLGQSVPLSDLATFVQEIQPPLVVLVAMTEASARALMEWPRWLPDAAQTGRPVIGYGGYIFGEQPVWRERVPGTFLGRTLREGIAHVDHILSGDHL